MIVARTEKKTLPFVVRCDDCGQDVKAENGTIMVLARADDAHRTTTEIFFTHRHCEARFEAANLPPAAHRWAKLDLGTFLGLLERTTSPAKVPVIVNKQ